MDLLLVRLVLGVFPLPLARCHFRPDLPEDGTGGRRGGLPLTVWAREQTPSSGDPGQWSSVLGGGDGRSGHRTLPPRRMLLWHFSGSPNPARSCRAGGPSRREASGPMSGSSVGAHSEIAQKRRRVAPRKPTILLVTENLEPSQAIYATSPLLPGLGKAGGGPATPRRPSWPLRRRRGGAGAVVADPACASGGRIRRLPGSQAHARYAPGTVNADLWNGGQVNGGQVIGSPA